MVSLLIVLLIEMNGLWQLPEKAVQEQILDISILLIIGELEVFLLNSLHTFNQETHLSLKSSTNGCFDVEILCRDDIRYHVMWYLMLIRK